MKIKDDWKWPLGFVLWVGLLYALPYFAWIQKLDNAIYERMFILWIPMSVGLLFVGLYLFVVLFMPKNEKMLKKAMIVVLIFGLIMVGYSSYRMVLLAKDAHAYKYEKYEHVMGVVSAQKVDYTNGRRGSASSIVAEIKINGAWYDVMNFNFSEYDFNDKEKITLTYLKTSNLVVIVQRGEYKQNWNDIW